MKIGKIMPITIPLLGLALAGCSGVSQGPHGGHDISWYLHHQKKMTQEISWCKNSAGRDKLESCKNAEQASSNAVSYNAKKTMKSIGNALS
ncbi:EexN family lipoprotein [Acidithiobacillus montserratensis]|uniref:EexN family lipoprotein n=1 Tax=Acidithiobacillus montserratensis TaxID=2729135 RepID=A0ACD5HCH4_9PROT|nr:EexN family lipoprotein [Acidithiobacillus montserratensis]MBN2680321.1 EexN family lipoprotein [Acidithiobacillaceae bacterium]MBU2748785.1 EexN family lipoprotein [Acidithiobacillus montserratensis]